MCGYCSDWRCVAPAYSIDFRGSDDELGVWLAKAQKEKKFVSQWLIHGVAHFAIVEKCPECGYEFTERDYDGAVIL